MQNRAGRSGRRLGALIGAIVGMLAAVSGYGNPCGPECRATQTLRVLTDGSLIPNGDKLLRSLDEAMVALASGDGQAAPSKQAQDYGRALKALAKYVDDLNKLAGKQQVPPTIAVDLNHAAAAIIVAVQDLISG